MNAHLERGRTGLIDRLHSLNATNVRFHVLRKNASFDHISSWPLDENKRSQITSFWNDISKDIHFDPPVHIPLNKSIYL
jgi:hypothetical protein